MAGELILNETASISVPAAAKVGLYDDGIGGMYNSSDRLNGLVHVPGFNIFRLAANGAAIGAGIADYFGASSAFPTELNGRYEIIYYVYYLKTTAGTVVYTLTNTQTYTNIAAWYQQAPAAGIATNAAMTAAGIVTTTAAAAALPATASLSSAVNHAAVIYAIAEVGTAGNIRLRATESAGTITPLRGSLAT